MKSNTHYERGEEWVLPSDPGECSGHTTSRALGNRPSSQGGLESVGRCLLCYSLTVRLLATCFMPLKPVSSFVKRVHFFFQQTLMKHVPGAWSSTRCPEYHGTQVRQHLLCKQAELQQSVARD